MNKKNSILPQKKFLRAYTLLELLVVTALISIISMFAFPYSLNQVSQNKARNAAINISSLIFTTQQEAYSRKFNQSHGVVFQTNNLILYQGTSLSEAVSQESIDLPDEIHISSVNLNNGGDEINFPAGDFRPNNPGTVNITENGNNYQIIINKEGLIYYKSV